MGKRFLLSIIQVTGVSMGDNTCCSDLLMRYLCISGAKIWPDERPISYSKGKGEGVILGS